MAAATNFLYLRTLPINNMATAVKARLRLITKLSITQFVFRYKTNMTLVAICIFLFTPVAIAGYWNPDPRNACGFLADHSLKTTGWFKRAGSNRYECRSYNHALLTDGATNNSIRYFARGNENEVDQLRLTLQIRAHGDVQRAHRRLLQTSAVLLKSALNAELTEEMKNAILSGTVQAKWLIDGAEIRLTRSLGYELRFDITIPR